MMFHDFTSYSTDWLFNYFVKYLALRYSSSAKQSREHRRGRTLDPARHGVGREPKRELSQYRERVPSGERRDNARPDIPIVLFQGTPARDGRTTGDTHR